MKTTALLLLVAALAWGPTARAQTGCPGPQAATYTPAARRNDGSCQYAPTVAALPARASPDAAVPETSGLQLAAGALWTFSDGGNPPGLFRRGSSPAAPAGRCGR